MKVLILAGGHGTRLSEETQTIPKPMVEIGGKPILWHIMKLYSHFGFNQFIILLGYKGYVIKEYFANYFLHNSNLTIDLSNNKFEVHNHTSEPWTVTLLDTGLNTMTGGRILKAREFIKDEAFMLTYGDGIADINIPELIAFHQNHGQSATMSIVQAANRFGMVDRGDNGLVSSFIEKPKEGNAWINGGFFVCNPDVFDYIEDDATMFENEPLQALAFQNKLYAYQHRGFWKCMDTLRDKIYLNTAYDSGQADWVVWK